jgi:hypothetical protein
LSIKTKNDLDVISGWCYGPSISYKILISKKEYGCVLLKIYLYAQC